MSSAPQCFIEPVENISQPLPTAFPAIPQAQGNFSSLVSAVNALRQGFLQLTGQLGQSGNAGPSQAQGGSKVGSQNKDQQQKKNQKSRFTETNRATAQVTLKSTDGSVEFTIEQINSLTLTDNVTGENWTWYR